ncbi:MAG: tRNA uridine-5-carboxymethylaminomethyl(34) synthesis GTPase MnmE [Duodenibacillus sp.]|nr:tRNA uridine-5-carboxymethylaminomethyl(34) synthesis GTPase MnmE [Duodenibacillus sp.]
MQLDKAPIIARASAPGRGGIGILRISGSPGDVAAIARGLFGGRRLEERHAHLLAVRDAAGALIDRVIALRFAAPRSYTGEEVLELQAHGGAAVLQRLLGRCLQAGAGVGLRGAQPGEFTLRAYLSGKIDLFQAEAVGDLVDAQAAGAARAAARSLSGEFSARIRAMNEALVELRVYVEASLDFAEEDIGLIADGRVLERSAAVAGQLEAVLACARRGRVMRDGLAVVLAGAPNVGKSSLMNALAGEDLAIVTDVAGTTRDRIEHAIEVEGVPVRLIDTAGLRRTDDAVEAIGVERTLKALETADLVLELREAAGGGGGDAEASALMAGRLPAAAQRVTVYTKADLLPAPPQGEGLYVSSRTGYGMDRLAGLLKDKALGAGEGDCTVRARHVACIERARAHIERVRGALQTAELDIAAEELRGASRALEEIVGEVIDEDILGRIFESFCVGK